MERNLREKFNNLVSKYWFLGLVLLAIPIIWPLFIPGFFGVSDDMHVAWLYEMDRVIKLGQIPPRFVPDLSFGFGYPLFNFVFPLPYYVGEIFHLIGFSLVDSVKLVFGFSLILSAVFMYRALKELISPFLSFCGAILYIYAPYRAVDTYVRGAIGENVAFVFFPLVILSILKLTAASPSLNKRIGLWMGTGALSVGFLVLSHNIATYMFLPFALAMGFVRALADKNFIPKIGRLLITVLLGLSLSIYFWLPALLDSSLMKYDTVFNFADHFPTIKQLIFPYWGYGASVPGPYDHLSFNIGVANLLLILTGLVSLFIYWRKIESDKKIIIVWAGVSFLIVVFMMNYRSSLLWQTLPLLPYFQFPWRFLMMTTLLSPIFLTGLEKVSYSYLFIFVLTVVAVLSTVEYFKPADFLGRADSYYLNRYIPVPTASPEYYNLMEEYLRLPKNTEQRPNQVYPTVYPLQDGTVKVQKVNDLNVYIETDSNRQMEINYNKYFFPGWLVYIDGREETIAAGKPYGQISVNIPAGEHKLEILFRETLFNKILDGLSLLALTVAIFLSLSYRKGFRKVSS